MKYIKDLSKEIINQIKQKLYLNGNNVLRGFKYLSNECLTQIYQLLKNNQNYQNQRQILKAIFFNYDLNKCKICNKDLNIRKRNNKYCSIKCKFKDQQYKNNVKNTLLKKYGVTHNFLIKDIRNKALSKATSIQSKQKRKNTNLKKIQSNCQF